MKHSTVSRADPPSLSWDTGLLLGKNNIFWNNPPCSVWNVNETFVLMFCSLQNFCKLFLTTNHHIFCRPQLQFNLLQWPTIVFTGTMPSKWFHQSPDLIWCDRAAVKTSQIMATGTSMDWRWKMIHNICHLQSPNNPHMSRSNVSEIIFHNFLLGIESRL